MADLHRKKCQEPGRVRQGRGRVGSSQQRQPGAREVAGGGWKETIGESWMWVMLAGWVVRWGRETVATLGPLALGS